MDELSKLPQELLYFKKRWILALSRNFNFSISVFCCDSVNFFGLWDHKHCWKMIFLCIMIILTSACLKFKLACLWICATIVNKTLLEKIIETIRWKVPSSAILQMRVADICIYCIFGSCDVSKRMHLCYFSQQVHLKRCLLQCFDWVTLMFDQRRARVVYSAENLIKLLCLIVMLIQKLDSCTADISELLFRSKNFTRPHEWVLGKIIAFLHRLG